MGFTRTTAVVVCLAAVAAGQTPASIDALMEAGHWKRVRQIASAKIASDPNDAQARAWLSKAKLSLNEFEGAVADAERAVAADPKNPAFQGQLAEACASAAEHVSPIKGIGFIRCAHRAIEASLAVNPSHVDTLLVEMMFSWKAPSIAGGDRKKAFKIAQQIQGIAPVWGYLAQARLLQDSGEDATVERTLLNAVKADPTFLRARLSLARFYCCTAKTKNFDAAEKAAREALHLDSSAGAAYEILARVYAAQRRWTDLEAIVAQATAAVPDDRSPYYGAADQLISMGQDFRRAERYLRFYLEQAPEGRTASKAEAHWQLARLHEGEGLKDEAVQELLTAIRFEPNFEPARRDLKRLRRA